MDDKPLPIRNVTANRDGTTLTFRVTTDAGIPADVTIPMDEADELIAAILATSRAIAAMKGAQASLRERVPMLKPAIPLNDLGVQMGESGNLQFVMRFGLIDLAFEVQTGRSQEAAASLAQLAQLLSQSR